MISQLAKLNPGQTDRMIKLAVRKPSVNKDSITNKGLPVLGLWPKEASLVRKITLEVLNLYTDACWLDRV